MTLTDLLATPYYRSNKTLLSKDLGVSRNTLNKYLEDKDGASHVIRKQYGEYVLFGKLTKGDK